MVVERGKDVVIEGLACSSTHIPPLSIHPVHKKKNTHTTHTHIYYEYFFFFTMCVYTLWPAVDHLQNHHHHDDDYEETRWASSSLISHLLHHLRISLNHTHIYTVVGQREREPCTEPRSLYSAALLILLCVLYYIRVLLCWKILAQSSRASSGT